MTYAFMFFILSMTYFFIAVYALTKNSKDLNNITYFFVLVLFAFGSLFITMQYMVTDPIMASAIRRYSVISWGIVYSVLFHCIFSITGYYNKIKKTKYKTLALALIYLPGLVNFILYLPVYYLPSEMVLTDNGWQNLQTVSHGFLWDNYFIMYYSIFSVLSLIVLVMWNKTINTKREKRQSQVLFTAFIIAFILGTVFEIVLPELGTNILSGITSFTTIFPMLLILYSIDKYGLLNFTPEKVGSQVMEITREGIIICKRNGEIDTVNEGALILLNYKDKKDLTNISQLGFIVANLFENKPQETILKRKDDSSIHVLLDSKLIKDSIGEIYGSLLIFQDLSLLKETQNKLEELNVNLEEKIALRTEELVKMNNELHAEVEQRVKAEAEIKEIVFKDHLTGVFNRRYYDISLVSMDKVENYPLTIIMCDINGLKLINDAFGHISGDELLKSAAQLLTENCREKDIISRIGGDEFVILMPNTTSIEAEEVIDTLNEKAKEISIQHIELSISYGYTTKREQSENINEVYTRAEDLMYREKLIHIPSMRSNAIETILKTLYERDENSESHSRRVSQVSEALCKALKLNRQDVSEVKTAALLHDIGKILISKRIINKNGKLTIDEFVEIKNHPEVGYRILNSTQQMRSISNIVLSHHERWDGKGYPMGLVGKKIPYKSRIISIADAFDAMTSHRTYQKIKTKEEALEEIINNRGTQFDPEMVKVFAEHFEDIIKNLD